MWMTGDLDLVVLHRVFELDALAVEAVVADLTGRDGSVTVDTVRAFGLVLVFLELYDRPTGRTACSACWAVATRWRSSRGTSDRLRSC